MKKENILIEVYAAIGGTGLTMGNIMTDTLADLSRKESAQGNAILNTVQQFAGAIGTSVTSTIVAISQVKMGSKSALPTAIGSQHAYLILSILVIVIFFILAKLVKKIEN